MGVQGAPDAAGCLLLISVALLYNSRLPELNPPASPVRAACRASRPSCSTRARLGPGVHRVPDSRRAHPRLRPRRRRCAACGCATARNAGHCIAT
jgi:hypothetical protein